MSTAVKQFHEEEAIGKTYDLQVARRLLRYLKPYLRLLLAALALTLAESARSLQPKFTQYAIDWYILPRKTDGSDVARWLVSRLATLRLIFSYFQSIFSTASGST
jgi:ATP-binding cassette subfamily B multidrug efflux pump